MNGQDIIRLRDEWVAKGNRLRGVKVSGQQRLTIGKNRHRVSERVSPRSPCSFLGETTGEQVVCESCVGTRLKVFRCALHVRCTLERQGPKEIQCCAGCRDYQPRRDAEGSPDGRIRSQPTSPESRRPPKAVRIPEPPPLSLPEPSPGKKRRDRVVVTAAVGPEYSELLALSRPSLAEYARRVDADFLVLDWNPTPPWGFSAKFQLARVLDLYERVIFLDADVLVTPTTPNLFAEVPLGQFAMYDDAPEILMRGASFIDEYQRLRESQGLPRAPVWGYWNTGVMVFDRSHRGVFDLPPRPFLAVHCAEQHWIVARIHDLGIRVRPMPKRLNYQPWFRADLKMRDAPADGILHFAGQKGEERIQSMMDHVVSHTLRPSRLLPDFRVRTDWEDGCLEMIHQTNEYRLPGRLDPDDLILDVGAHVGTFARTCLDRGAGQVLCVEPDRAACAVLRVNLAQSGILGGDSRIEIVEAAAWDERMKSIYLRSPRPDSNTGEGQTSESQASQGVPVKTQQMGDLIRQLLSMDTADPILSQETARAVRLVKLDVEGAEWRLLADGDWLDLVQEVVGEYHLGDRYGVGSERRLTDLVTLLAPRGFQVEIVPDEENRGHFFARRVGCA